MEESSDNPKDVVSNNTNQASATKNKQKTRPVKRKRGSSSESENELPDNILETERSVHASAVKNNLDERDVRKILKKVVANDRVLAMVKLREEEENELSSNIEPKPVTMTRLKTKELMKVSPKTVVFNYNLTPIKHIPVKTRPEVTALIAQDLPEDEDDDEYKPTQEDVPSDDDQTLESCSDVESQPRTPATPIHPDASSPKVVKDGPFKIPQNIATKRKLDLEEEEATIARRTRSKLSLSSTSIEHIESTFIPPDDIPMPAVDDLWNQFLNECLNPASTSKHEDDDEADPEYNVAADPDAVEEDEENLSNSIIKISQKELNDLVTELIAVMPPETDENLAENLVNSVLTDTSQSEITRWEGKQEPTSDEDATETISNRLQAEKTNAFANNSFGKTEPKDYDEHNDVEQNNATNVEKIEVICEKHDVIEDKNDQNDDKIDESVRHDGNTNRNNESVHINDVNKPTDDDSEGEMIIIEVKNEDMRYPMEINGPSGITMAATVSEQATIPPPNDSAPPLIRQMMDDQQSQPVTQIVVVEMEPEFVILPEQIQIFQQQLRQHIQLATSNFLQLYIHPIHWQYAPTYKEYVESFVKMCRTKPNSVANVCNLNPALELILSWESTVSANTPENKALVKFIEVESEKCRHRNMNHCTTVGDFPEPVRRVVANSAVFLYPHLLPPTPYKPDHTKRFSYIVPEDNLIALGLSEFWDYVESNKKLFKIRQSSKSSKRRAGLTVAIEQMVKYMFPWMTPRHVMMHVQHIKKHGHSENAINIFFKKNKVVPVKHKLLSFNPQMTLYEHPENEIPRPWLRYLAKTSNRFKKCFTRTDHILQPTTGVPVELGKLAEVPKKNPLSIDFTQNIATGLPNTNLQDKFDINVNNPKQDHLVATNLFSVIQTNTGIALIPLIVQDTNVVASQVGPITTPAEVQSNIVVTPIVQEATQDNVTIEPEKSKEKITKNVDGDHCECCVMLRKICNGPKLITDYFQLKNPSKKECQCRNRKYPNVSNRLKLLLRLYKSQSGFMFKELVHKLKNDSKCALNDYDMDDFEYAVLFQMKFITRLTVMLRHASFKRRIYTLFNEFNVDTDDPVKLAQKIQNSFKKDLCDLYIEFLGFLTAQQAERLGVFRHYLVSYINCIMKRIDEEISDIERRKSILTKLKQCVNNLQKLTTCQMCKSLLVELKDYPRVAQYIFSLFPHKKCTPQKVTLETVRTNDKPTAPSNEPIVIPDEPIVIPDVPAAQPDEPIVIPDVPAAQPDEPIVIPDEPIVIPDEPVAQPNEPVAQPDEPIVISDEPAAQPDEPTAQPDEPTAPTDEPITMNQEDEAMSSDCENSEQEPVIVGTFNERQIELEVVKQEPVSEEESTNVISTALNEESLDDSRETPDNTMVIVEDDTQTDNQEWSREDDKLLLEIIKKYLATEESKNKSIFKTLQENKVYELIAERLTEKSMDNIVQRVIYLLEVLVVNNS
ncbi:uncharacterized protein LOC115448860 isoform X2 [Manduca sexta]|uniref:uncharacterized protein LOC115448860 isoform X2 n=1 Tax=Manduca sexta TaxID=7130 RepID=UPI00188E653A|nr:uncharacterized protein LOC115448860 isoform X2 [Manduca sexta]